MAVTTPLRSPTAPRVNDRRARREGKKGGGVLLLLLLGGGVTWAWYESSHTCTPACGPCEKCSGGHCSSTCPAGQVCGPDGSTCVPAGASCNPPCGPGQTCVNGVCVTTIAQPCDYIVKSGDILMDIAARVYGATTFPNGAVIWEWLYNQNPQIKTIAEQHGHYSNWWHWIYPGEVIHCPVCPPGSGRSDGPNCNV